jgi:hypothetical protein
MGIRLAKVYDLATTTSPEVFFTYITATVPAPNVVADDVFGTGIFH